MKKAFATILAVIYLSTSMGATVHLHYCMDKLFSWSLANEDSQNCGHCGMPKNAKDGHCMAMKDGCCKDKQAVVKLDKDQKASESAYNFLHLASQAVIVQPVIQADIYVAAYIAGYPTTNAPPEPDKVPVFLRNCNFRI
ncbi:MAG TPA: hypothetical protein VHE34_16445 [Puia sp.]|uniref:HYC_CC_PP family protein n=1 Tax=Puia sp. TaxID=2045100 RepID=UPI00092C0B3C|nr:hypothetical protein [Puia sp.]MBN8852695.1 hypothetical protein [Sphingobacteriales bacterium]OJW55519.1 MAG: hypothetical protein BGO55_02965 [Sphingobacteriales bacterium 50-39]HVU96821.1 hypothetical protein [Puia sp.]